MSLALLAKLRVKEPPKPKETVSVLIREPQQRQEVSLKTKIIDRTDENIVDRRAFLSNLSDRLPIVRRERVPMVAPPIEQPPAVEIAPALEQPPVEQPPVEQPPVETARPVEQPPVETAPPVEQPSVETAPPVEQPPVAPPKKTVKARKTLKLVEKLQPEEKVEITEPLTKKPRKKLKIVEPTVKIIPETLIKIDDKPISERLPPKQEKILIKASAYYLNNREIFINFINSLFAPYKRELTETSETTSCDVDPDTPFSLMTHQKIVKDYINLYTPYRGILIYHGLGSGKTCSSIAIAEGMKTDKQVIVMTPASLRRNYIEELKKCGDMMYRKNQHWEFIKATQENVPLFSALLGLSEQTIRKQEGVWLVDIRKPANYAELIDDEKKSLDKQLDEMIKYKYKFISYNGLRRQHLRELTDNGKKNPFDNTVVIIDEAHNFVSRIVNKIGVKGSLPLSLYDLLMNADNVKIILLTGTPIINYPNEIAVLFNILRGYIKTWSFKLDVSSERKINKEYFESLFKSTVLGGNVMDYIDYNSSSTILKVTRNPFGFVNKTTKGKYDGVRLGERGEMTDTQFVEYITLLLKKNRISILNTQVDTFKALPDKLDLFKARFIDSENNVINMNLFKRRVLGLTSYFRSAQESLMPAFTKSRNFHIVDIPMSDFQFGVYEEARVQERKLELNQKRRRQKQAGTDLYDDSVSTYRIFSRAFCNFVFPRPDIKRPLPGKSDELTEDTLEEAKNEDVLDAVSQSEKIDDIDGKYDADEVEAEAKEEDTTYDERIKLALQSLSENKTKYLTADGLKIYSPKFLKILENLENPENRGLHLIYSQFRTLEGIGILKLVLEANGYAEFKIKQVGGNWVMDVRAEDRSKPKFALYTGTETSEEKEIIRNVFNGAWKYVPPSLERQLREINTNNIFGEVIKAIMITASGAEGISLRNVRYVHITEPYWHPVRIQQVIGRARRICSHQDLPEELRTVDVFLYLMSFSKEQLASDKSLELRLKDRSKIDNTTAITSDQALYEIATLKEEITDKILMAVKESAIDCSIHARKGSSENLQCFTFGPVTPDKYAFVPSIDNEQSDNVAQQNLREKKLKGYEVVIQGIPYVLDRTTGYVYDSESYKMMNPIQVGRLVPAPDGNYVFEKI